MKKTTCQYLILLSLLLIACQTKPDRSYTLSEEMKDSLNIFLKTDHFSDQEWDQRGLIPSSQAVENEMNSALQDAVKEVLEQEQDLTENRVKQILIKQLKQKETRLDTEEREYLSDLFFELADILKVDIKTE
ncbi:MAG: hypothetical protein K0R51_71 [Cytophagaceae bacterium]|jgi:hypothetical protein|nr:hypothetical protein [Cytophagaceae bacterium]